MKWIIRVTHQDDMALSTTCEYVIMEDALEGALIDLRLELFKEMVKRVEDKLKEKNTKGSATHPKGK